ncbi:MAG: hypothetical protein M3041_14275 [Acidobacteriota bacterium]|nr:hypothetical protein [Acidobacteriota bacterium]
MKRLAIVPLLLAVSFCQSSQPGSGTVSLPGHGAISVQVMPNPIVAVSAGGNNYDFPVDVLVRETGGRGVTVSRVTATVYGPAGIKLGDQSWDAAQIKDAGFPTNLPGNGDLRYHFVPRKSVPDDRLFSSVHAELRVDAYDDTNTPTSATTSVSITR